jgi:hypothetical protein
MDQVRRDGTVPAVAELCEDLAMSVGEMAGHLKDLEAAFCVAVQDQAHAGQKQFQDEPLERELPAAGEIVYARPFAAFKNHYQVWVDGEHRWYAECAVEACPISQQFPAAEVVVRSVCRQTKEPAELVGRDGALLDYSPRTLRVHLGYPVRAIPSRVVAWCDYNSYFASDEAARQWQTAHPEVHGITTTPEALARMMTETVGKGRIEYNYQPGVPVLQLILHMGRYGLTRPGPLGLRVPDPFWLPGPGMVREWRRQGMKSFFRYSFT